MEPTITILLSEYTALKELADKLRKIEAGTHGEYPMLETSKMIFGFAGDREKVVNRYFFFGDTEAAKKEFKEQLDQLLTEKQNYINNRTSLNGLQKEARAKESKINELQSKLDRLPKFLKFLID